MNGEMVRGLEDHILPGDHDSYAYLITSLPRLVSIPFSEVSDNSSSKCNIP